MSEQGQFAIRWIDSGREPKCPPDPNFPNGKDCDLSNGKVHCKVNVPHPTPRCGYWFLKCERCGSATLATTAGRPDDPRSFMIACKRLDA